ncbi:MAG: ParB/RepB/Spo0J family partition protein [Verrucomicrobiota bacterium]
MSDKKPALGRGLGALLKPVKPTSSPSPARESRPSGGNESRLQPLKPTPTAPDARLQEDSGSQKERVLQLSTSVIIPSTMQPRKEFEEGALHELMESIREHGVIQPLVVREHQGKYELIAGERRYRACVLLKLKTVPAILRDASNQDILEMALIENLQREDLNPVEEARAYHRLSREFGLRQEDIAKKVGKSRAAVANSMRLLSLEETVLQILTKGDLTAGHAKAILSLGSEAEQKQAAETIVNQRLSVREAERLVAETLQSAGEKGTPKKPTSRPAPSGPELPGYLLHIQEQLQSHFATKVRIQQKEDQGKIEIEYYGDEQLDRILDLMRLEIQE